MPNFEREGAIKDLDFWWEACLTHNFLTLVYSLIKQNVDKWYIYYMY